MTAAAPLKNQIVTIQPLYLAKRDAATFLSLSESTLEALVAKGELSKPRKLSNGRIGWLVKELITWGEARPISDLLPPPDSGYGRAGKPA